MIAAPSSGSGKTTVTMGLIRALKNRGLDVCGYKVGPDYIDPAFLAAASGKPARNLDLHLQGEHGVAYSIAQANSGYGVIEGVMGYFDGIYNTWQNSSYHISTLLEVPTVLVYTPKGEMFSAIPKIKGMAEFEDSMIQAVIFNNVSQHYYELLKDAVERHTDLRVLGFAPKMEEVKLKSRHLGLVQSVEISNLDQKIERIAETIEEHVDISALIEIMQECKIYFAKEQIKICTPMQNKFCTPKRNLMVAVAKDQAFSFYYTENLQLLEEVCQVVYFSPLQDKALPPCDLLYLGGGYPEVFNKELSHNTPMLSSIKSYAERGGCIYAECGGFMYLTEYVEDARMVGIFRGKTHLTPKLQRFGYVDIELKKDCLLGCAGDRLTGHEFHKSVSELEGETVYTIRKTMGTKTWECGYIYKNVLAGYPHISFIGYPEMLDNMLNYVEKKRKNLCT